VADRAGKWLRKKTHVFEKTFKNSKVPYVYGSNDGTGARGGEFEGIASVHGFKVIKLCS